MAHRGRHRARQRNKTTSCHLRPFVLSRNPVDIEEVRCRPLQELRLELVSRVVYDDDRARTNQRGRGRVVDREDRRVLPIGADGVQRHRKHKSGRVRHGLNKARVMCLRSRRHILSRRLEHKHSAPPGEILSRGRTKTGRGFHLDEVSSIMTALETVVMMLLARTETSASPCCRPLD